MVQHVEIGSILELCRERVELDPKQQYTLIGIYSWGKGLLYRRGVPGANAGTLRFFKLPANALLISNIQAWEGAIAVTSAADTDCVASSRFLAYQPKEPEQVDVNYVLHYLLSDAGMEQVRRASPGTQVRNRTLGIAAFESIRIPLTSLREQRDVVARVRRATRTVELSGNSCRLSVALASAARNIEFSVLEESMTRSDRAFEQVGASHTRGQNGATRVLLGDILTPSANTQRVQAGEEYPMARIMSFARGIHPGESRDGTSISYSNLIRLELHDFVYQKLMAWEGAFGIVDERCAELYVSPENCVFAIDRERVEIGFLKHLIAWEPQWRKWASRSVGTNVRRRRLYPEQLLEEEILLPDLDSQRRIASRLDSASLVLELAQRREQLASALLRSTKNSEFASLDAPVALTRAGQAPSSPEVSFGR